MNDSLAVIAPTGTAIGRPAATARRLVDASVSANTRRAYAGARRRRDAWLAGRPLDDVSLAAYLAELHDGGRASSSAAMAVAAACFRAKLAGQPHPAGERTARVLAGYRRTAGDRGRGQARQFTADDLAAVLATCHLPRRRGQRASATPPGRRAAAPQRRHDVAEHGVDDDFGALLREAGDMDHLLDERPFVRLPSVTGWSIVGSTRRGRRRPATTLCGAMIAAERRWARRPPERPRHRGRKRHLRPGHGRAQATPAAAAGRRASPTTRGRRRSRCGVPP